MALKALGNVTVINVNDGQDGQPGQQGAQGVSIVNSVPQYYLSTSSTQLTGGSWSYTPWEVTDGTYLWERLENTLSDGSTTYSNAVYSVTISGVKHDVDDINQSITNKVWQSDITNQISSYDNSTVSTIRDRVTQTETDITGITSRVSDVESTTGSLGTRMTNAETTIQQTSSNVLIQATSSATTAAEGGQYLINSLINVAPSGVQISADKVNIAGAAIFDNYSLKSQTVSNVVVEYAKSSSSSSFTPVPGAAGQWSTASPTWDEDSYIWQRTSKTINGNTEYTYTCIQGAKGQDGDSSYTYVRYSANSDGSNMVSSPTSDTKYIGIYVGTSSTVPAYTAFSWSKYIGEDGDSSYTYVRYSPNSDGSSMTSSPQANSKYIGLYIGTSSTAPSSAGSYTWSQYRGNDGTSVSITEIKYATSTTDAQPSDSSFTYDSVPTVAEGSWLWTRTTYSSGTKLYTKAKQGTSGTNGTNGTNGLNIATVYLYQRATSSPSKPSSNLTYTFSTHELSGTLGSWRQEIPSGTDPIWLTFATASATGDSDSIGSDEWVTPAQLAQDGIDGYNQATINLYTRTANTTVNKPTATMTYTFSTGVLSNIPSGWSREIPASDGNPCYVTSVSVISRESSYQITTSPNNPWSSPTKMVEDGVSAVVYSITPSVYAITKNEAGTLTPASVTFSATSKTGSGNASAYSGRFIIAESSNGTSWTNKYTSSGNESSKAYTPSANTIKFIRCSLYLAGGTTTLLDQETVAVVSDGIQGYSVVAYVTRDSFTESQWTTYGTIDHSETWSNTSDIRNGCRVGDLFAVVGTSTDGGKSHTAIYRATNASGNLTGTCIAHTFSDRGDDGDDAYTVILTNESHSFAAGTSAAVAGTATCKVITYKGASQIACYAGASSTATSISTNVTGLTCSISNNNSTNVTLTFSATTSLTTKNGTVSIPVVVDGKSFTKLFTFSLSLTGTSVTSVTTSESTADDGYSTVTIVLSDGSSKTFQVKNGSKGSTGDTAQWFYGTALSHTSGTATASVTGAVIGSMYLNTDSYSVYKCTNISGSTMTWTYAGNLLTGLVDSLEIGGTNLIIGGTVVRNKWINSSGAEQSSTKCLSTDYIPVDPSSDYTLQFWQPTNSQTGNNRAWTGKFMWYNSSKTYLSGYTATYFADEHVSFTGTSPSNAAYVRVTYQLPNGATVTPTNWSVLDKDYRWKLEKGNLGSDWSLAPEDALWKTQTVYRRTTSNSAPAAPTTVISSTTDPGASADWTTMHISRIYNNSGNFSYQYLWTCDQYISIGGFLLGNSTVVADEGTTVIDGATITTGTINADRLNISDIISRGSIALQGDVNEINANYGTSSTGASTQSKTVTCANFDFEAGREITIKFSNANTYVTNSNPIKLNINSKGAKEVWVGNTATNTINNDTDNININKLLWGAGASITFRCESYNSDYIFAVVGEPRSWYGSCTTAASTNNKVASDVAGCVICKGTIVNLAMTNENTGTSPNLNVQSTGNIAIYAGTGSSVDSTPPVRPLVSNGLSWASGSYQNFVFDGTQWRTGDSGTSARAKAMSDNAAKTATNFLVADSTGVMVYDGSGGAKTSSTVTTGNTLITSNGVKIRNGTSVLAEYGTGIVLYKPGTNTAVVSIDSNGGSFTGSITANSGYLGGSSGWTIEAQHLYSGTIGSDNSMHLGTKNLGSSTTIAGRSGSDWRLTVGSKFGVNNSGNLYSSGGTIGGWTINASTLSRIDGSSNTVSLSSTGISISKTVQDNFSETTLTKNYLLIDNYSGSAYIRVDGSTSANIRLFAGYSDSANCSVGTPDEYLSLYYNNSTGNHGLFFTNNLTGDAAFPPSYAPLRIDYLGTTVLQGYDRIDLYLTEWDLNGNTITSRDINRIVFYQNPDDANLLFRPNSSGDVYLGSSANRWNTIFTNKAVNTGSDLKTKNIIEEHDWKVDEFIQGLKPIAYRLKDSDSGRIHLGFGAQDVAKLSKDLNIGDLSLYEADIICENRETKKYHGEEIDDSRLNWGLKYSEFIAPMVLEIQRLMDRVSTLENELYSIKNFGSNK